jgi:hypothetical protein
MLKCLTPLVSVNGRSRDRGAWEPDLKRTVMLGKRQTVKLIRQERSRIHKLPGILMMRKVEWPLWRS